MMNAAHDGENYFSAPMSCPGSNVAVKKEKGGMLWTGLFYVPQSVHPWKCGHIFETRDGYRHIGDMTSISVS